ncbi:MAG TPA: hypothetical protein VKX49_11190 [Bryobacteraceae bacterium]|nr:hypothetical protein [Bryobacteraceae bacterium]
MRNRIAVLLGLPVLAAALIVSIAAPAAGQTSSAAAKKYSAPRMPDGHPDLQGTYDLATITPLERTAGTPLVLSKEQALKMETQRAAQRERADAPIDANRSAPPKGGDGSRGAAGNVGGYNSGWLDPGSTFTVVNGEKRSSLIVDPADGRVPALTPAARQRMARLGARPTSDAQESSDPGLDPTPGAYDDPERRPLGERCLLGFGSTSGPPALPDYFYNNLHQIVQTPDSIMILTEMVHDARIVRMNKPHLPKSYRLWFGDSVGHWEGDTLVVDTTNFNDKTRFRGSTENLHVVERFTRVDDKTLLYQFTIDDPDTWTKPWTGEFTWPATTNHIYEYACHEANYALTDILKGARLREKEEASKATR